MSRAVVFAGQGAQTVGMGKDLAEAVPACRELFERADDVLGYSLSAICFHGPEEELTRSDHCQPAIFVASMACYRALCERVPALDAAFMAGLSLGEWTALHAAGALSFDETLRVLEARGRFMQDACEQQRGGMVSVIGLPADVLQEICGRTGVVMANLNSPAQTVLSGEADAVRQAAALASEAGAKRAIPLAVAGAFHSPLMQEAADRLQEVLAGVTFAAPRPPVVANVTGRPHAADGAGIGPRMIEQVTHAVQWYPAIEWMQAQGVASFVECGPGKVLSGLIKRIDRNLATCHVEDLASLEKTAEELAGACGGAPGPGTAA